MASIEIEVSLRTKNQLTLPEEIARRLGVGPGDRLLLTLEGERGDTASIRPIRRSYAGALAGVYGGPDEVTRYLEDERRSWGQ